MHSGSRPPGYRSAPSGLDVNIRVTKVQVSFVGKAATLCLMYAFPLLFLGAHDGAASEVVRIFGWAFAVWGVALYWWAALLYLTQIRELVKGAHPS